MHTLHSLFIKDAQVQFCKIPHGFFECCYVNAERSEATYALTLAKDNDTTDFNEVIWYRTVNVLTGAVVNQGNALPMGEYASLVDAISTRYNAEFIRFDSIKFAFEYARDAEVYMNKEGASYHHKHIVFGQSVHKAPASEIEGKTSDGQKFCVTRSICLL